MAIKLVFITDLGGYCFPNRVVNDWKRLGGHAVCAESIGGFKTCIQEGPRLLLTQ